jgi:hypothetical protein
MTEPRRLLSDPRGGLESELLRAGLDEEPSPRAVERTVAAVGAGAATLGVAGIAASAPLVVGTTAAATSLGVTGTVKLLAIGAAVGLASGGALLGVTKVVEHRAPQPVPAVAPARSAPVALPPAPALPQVAVVVPPAPVAAPTEEVPAPRAAVTSAPSTGTPLTAEVALVDRAHALLRGGDARGALGVLARYESAFAAPRLLPEVFALRMEASESAGDGGAARLWASRLVTRYPRSAQAAKARALLGDAPDLPR